MYSNSEAFLGWKNNSNFHPLQNFFREDILETSVFLLPLYQGQTAEARA